MQAVLPWCEWQKCIMEAESSDLLNCLLLIQQLLLISPLTKAFLATRFRFFITDLAPLSTCSITHERKGTTGCIPEAEKEEKHVLYDLDKIFYVWIPKGNRREGKKYVSQSQHISANNFSSLQTLAIWLFFLPASATMTTEVKYFSLFLLLTLCNLHTLHFLI